MTADAPRFRNAHGALNFAYKRVRGHAKAASAERAIADQGLKRYHELPPAGSRPYDVNDDPSGEASYIIAKVERLPQHLCRAIEARYAIHAPAIQQQAQRELMLHVRPALKGPLVGADLEPVHMRAVLLLLVQHHYDSGKRAKRKVEPEDTRLRLNTLAELAKVAERTMFRRYSEVRRALAEIERDALARVEIALEAVGVCEGIKP